MFLEPKPVEKLFNRLFGFLVGLGFGLEHNYLLQVRGRKSGRVYSTPVNVLDVAGKRYLVAPRGRTQWVRNAEAVGRRDRAEERALPPELPSAGHSGRGEAGTLEIVFGALCHHRTTVFSRPGRLRRLPQTRPELSRV
jgi:hypothetical protein